MYISRKELKLVADERALIDMIELFCKNNNLEYEIFEKNYSETADKSLRKITTKETADIKVK